MFRTFADFAHKIDPYPVSVFSSNNADLQGATHRANRCFAIVKIFKHYIGPCFHSLPSFFFCSIKASSALYASSSKKGCPKAASIEWLLGRRSVLLRPFWPGGRVVATKSTTSSSLFYSTFIIVCLFFFVKRDIVSESLPISLIAFFDGCNNRIFKFFIYIFRI